jgi:hypothetical protein
MHGDYRAYAFLAGNLLTQEIHSSILWVGQIHIIEECKVARKLVWLGSSRKGIATPKEEIEMIKRRLKLASETDVEVAAQKRRGKENDERR